MQQTHPIMRSASCCSGQQYVSVITRLDQLHPTTHVMSSWRCHHRLFCRDTVTSSCSDMIVASHNGGGGGGGGRFWEWHYRLHHIAIMLALDPLSVSLFAIDLAFSTRWSDFWYLDAVEALHCRAEMQPSASSFYRPMCLEPFPFISH